MNIYFDNAATTRPHPQVLDKMLPYFGDTFGNPSSVHSFGRKARVAIEDAREIIAKFINADPSEIYFTSGGTEANNFVINGIAKTEYNESGRNHLISSSSEHPSILSTLKNLEKINFETTTVSINNSFIPLMSQIKDKLTPKTSLITIMNVNNETGSIFDISQLKTIVNNVFIHTDAVQRFGKIPLDVKTLGIDSLTASAHKLNGPKGIGLAYIKSGTPMNSLILGGEQERNLRAGTENVANIVGSAEAVKIALESLEHNFRKISNLKNYFVESINILNIIGIKVNSLENSSPYILSITLDPQYYKVDSESMLMFFDINGVAVSSGSACASGTLKPSHVILAAGYSEEYANGTLRFSFNAENTIQEVDYAITILQKISSKFLK